MASSPVPARKRKQEQEPADPEVTEVAPGVLRMQLPIRIPGLAHVNCYALLDDRGAALVDPGLPGPFTWRALKDQLRRAGLRPKDVHTVIVTHSHPDHFGGAGNLVRHASATVVGHHDFSFAPMRSDDAEPEVSLDEIPAERRDEAPGQDEPPPLPPPRPRPGVTPWGRVRGRPPLRMRLGWRLAQLVSRAPFVPRITQAVATGDRLRLAGREWQVVFTPGHTNDHICLHDPTEGVFLSGDHVLPTITPHISGLSMTSDPLKAYYDSLDHVGEITDVRTVLPAHGHPFTDLRGRTEAIKRHHDERLAKMKGIGREIGAATVEEFSKRLFQPRSWGWMAESETYAHLEHLRRLGEAEAHRNIDGYLVFETG